MEVYREQAATEVSNIAVPWVAPAGDVEVAEAPNRRANLWRDAGRRLVRNKLAMCGLVGVGLGKFDPELKAVPDMAERWESNADGSVWTFYMRKGAKWTNGDPVTAHDFEWSFKRQLDPATKAPYAGFLYDLKNAEAFNKEKPDLTRDSVGIKATDDSTLVATMEGPRGFFPVLASYTAALPAHRPSVEKYGDGDKWPTADRIVSNGPFN